MSTSIPSFSCLTASFLLLVGSLAARADHIPFTGLSSNHEGVVNWNVIPAAGNVEPPRVGHELTWLRGLPPLTNYYAYYYLASREFAGIDVDATSALRAATPVGFPTLVNALAANGFVSSDLRVRFGPMTLGNDDPAVWNYDAAQRIETRRYRGGTIRIQLAGQDLVAGAMPDFTFVVRYNVLANFADDQISGYTGPLSPTNNAAGSSAAVQAVASAFLADIGAGSLRLVMDSIQPEIQVELAQADKGRYGGFFEAQSGRIELLRPLRCTGGEPLGTDGFRFNLSGGDNNAAALIEATTDFRSWQPIATNAPFLGTVQVTDGSSTNQGQRFYRAVFR